MSKKQPKSFGEVVFNLPNMDGVDTPEAMEKVRRAHFVSGLKDAERLLRYIRKAVLSDPQRAIIHKAPRCVFDFVDQAEACMALEKACAVIRNAPDDAKRQTLEDVAFHFGYIAHGRFPRPLTESLPIVQWFGEAMGLEGSDRNFIADLVREGEAEGEKDRAEYLSAKCPHYGTAACLQMNCGTCGTNAPGNVPSETAEA